MTVLLYFVLIFGNEGKISVILIHPKSKIAKEIVLNVLLVGYLRCIFGLKQQTMPS